MIIKKYSQFLLRENKEVDWRDKYECRLVQFRGKTGAELAKEAEKFLSDKETIDNLDNPEFLDPNKEKKDIQNIINNFKKAEDTLWTNITFSSFFIILVLLMLWNGNDVDQGAIKKADQKLKEITGENLDKDSEKDNKDTFKLNSEKAKKQYEKNINDLKTKLNEERRLRDKMESNLKKLKEEKEKLGKERAALEKKNKELKEKQRLEEIKKRLNKIEIKISGKNPKG
jgi:hypothetical protein